MHTRREEYSADLVHLVVSGTAPEYSCGRAQQTGDFGVSHLVCGSSTFAHEIGHNSGVNHDRYVEYDEECDTDDDTPCFDDVPSAYAYGYVNQLGLASSATQERRWRTLMAYHQQCSDEDVICPKLMRFSNPEQSWYDDSLGVHGTSGLSSYSDAADAATRGPADAARTHREFAHDLANRVAREVPDLVVEGLQSSRLQAAPGTLVRLSAVVVNQGTSTGYEPETAVVVQGIAERLLVVGRRAVVGTVSGIKRPGSPCRPLSALPSSRGSYSYRACVSSALGETLTENNCSETVTVEIGVVDLQFSMSLSSSSVQAGAEVEIEGVVRNVGDA